MLWFRTMLSHVKRTLCVSVSILGVYLIKQDAFNLKVNILSPKDLYKFEKKRIKETFVYSEFVKVRGNSQKCVFRLSLAYILVTCFPSLQALSHM